MVARPPFTLLGSLSLCVLALLTIACGDPCKEEKQNCTNTGGSPSCVSSGAGCIQACSCSCTPPSGDGDLEDDELAVLDGDADEDDDSEASGKRVETKTVGLRMH